MEQQSDQNIFPSNNGSEIDNVEEIIQVIEGSESEPDVEELSSDHQSHIINKILEADSKRKPITDFSRYSSPLKSSPKIVEDTVINLEPVENNHYHDSDRNLFDKVMILSNSKGSYHDAFDYPLNMDGDYIYHDTNENPDSLFGLDRALSPDYQTPEMNADSPVSARKSFVPLPKIGPYEMEDSLVSKKQHRIEQLIDRMHTLIDTKNIMLLQSTKQKPRRKKSKKKRMAYY